jgi:hypothetical protein
MRFFRLSPAVLLVVCIGGTTGCLTVSGPRLPKALIVTKEQDQAVLDEVARFKDGKCLPNPGTATCPPSRAERDQIIYDLKMIIDRNYQDYAKSFEGTEDGSLFLGEITAATLSGTAGILADAGTKDILTLASTLAQSTSVSSQKNFYQKKTAYAIVVEMNAQRATKWSAIYDLMRNNNLNTYPLGAALSDLLEYRQQGTALQALASIEQNAGAKAEDAQDAVKETSTKPLSSK